MDPIVFASNNTDITLGIYLLFVQNCNLKTHYLLSSVAFKRFSSIGRNVNCMSEENRMTHIRVLFHKKQIWAVSLFSYSLYIDAWRFACQKILIYLH